MNFIENETSQKLRGGYYTPLDLSIFLSSWIKDRSFIDVLEPSCGDGVFFEAMSKIGGFNNVRVTGFEVDGQEARRARQRVSHSAFSDLRVNSEDFLSWALLEIRQQRCKFDAVLGNPPFVRYQYLPSKFQDTAESIFALLNVKFTKHTNAWVPFVLASVALLRPGGRLAMVIPSEIINVAHAQGLRTFLGKNCRKVLLIDPQEIWFEETLQGTVLLLAEKKKSNEERSEGVAIQSVKDREFLGENAQDLFTRARAVNGKTISGKWTRALLGERALTLFDDLCIQPDVYCFDDIATVDVGIVTGANKFFLVTDEVVERYSLASWAHPMFGRSEHCPGIIYDKRQHEENRKKNNATNFLWFKPGDKLGQSALDYIKYGERLGLKSRYKCKIRTPWYSVPSVYSTRIGMLKRAHYCHRLIYNDVQAYTTDTAYRVEVKGVDPKKIVGAFVNPLTMLSAELEGRHYGGGVLELVPSEIERLVVPIPRAIGASLADLDAMVRSMPMPDVLSLHGVDVLSSIGTSREDAHIIFDAWDYLCRRRHRDLS